MTLVVVPGIIELSDISDSHSISGIAVEISDCVAAVSSFTLSVSSASGLQFCFIVAFLLCSFVSDGSGFESMLWRVYSFLFVP